MTNYDSIRPKEMGTCPGSIPPEEHRRKPRLLIIGHARHGKDTFADLVVAQMGLSFISSSVFVGRQAIWEQWGKERYTCFDEMFEDRVNHRSIWFNFIVAYNTPNLARIGEEMMAKYAVYVGMRNPDEFHVCMAKNLFDHVIWVDGSSRHPPESKDSMGLTKDMANIWIDNNGPEDNLIEAVTNLQERLHKEGFDVNYLPKPSLYTKEMEKIWHEDDADKDMMGPGNYMATPIPDPCDPPVQLTLEESRDFHDAALKEAASSESYDWAKTKPKVGVNYSMEKHEQTGLTWEDMPLHATRVLDHGFFKVIGVMGSDLAIVEAARMSYGRGTKKVNSSAGLINYLVRNYHTSPLEMCEIKFHIRMPIFVMRQWVRHRTANLNEYSGRYSEMVRLFYVPENKQICLQDKVNKQGSAEPMDLWDAGRVRKSIESISNEAFDEYENLLGLGVSRETARIILPLNTYTEVVWKLDISNLIKFLRLRDDDHAQWEIRQYAKLVSEAVKKNFPLVFAAYEEVRNSQTFTMAEIDTLVTGDSTNLANSQFKRIAEIRNRIL